MKIIVFVIGVFFSSVSLGIHTFTFDDGTLISASKIRVLANNKYVVNLEGCHINGRKACAAYIGIEATHINSVALHETKFLQKLFFSFNDGSYEIYGFCWNEDLGNVTDNTFTVQRDSNYIIKNIIYPSGNEYPFSHVENVFKKRSRAYESHKVIGFLRTLYDYKHYDKVGGRNYITGCSASNKVYLVADYIAAMPPGLDVVW
ncbi:MAG: hypothetical protein QS748_03265 [Candidatus Endonucleobacter bathymodioli]|uniref:Uncharacterized protein n=1 Tax=Candidatus Endonucleibacter bathymodioli TaxID=539814 RepID=A0AA90SLV9_9GAMM|nr:hypothetical protein [Candidatus Endonucleobacter bathymodioli]